MIAITIEIANFKKPVYISTITGRTYEIPQSNRVESGESLIFCGIQIPGLLLVAAQSNSRKYPITIIAPY